MYGNMEHVRSLRTQMQDARTVHVSSHLTLDFLHFAYFLTSCLCVLISSTYFVPVYENAIVTDLSSVCFVSMKEYHNIGPMSQILMMRYYILETRSFHLHSVEAETRALIIFCLLSPIPHIHHL